MKPQKLPVNSNEVIYYKNRGIFSEERGLSHYRASSVWSTQRESRAFLSEKKFFSRRIKGDFFFLFK